MVAFRHPTSFSPVPLSIIFLIVALWVPTHCQVGLRTLPLTVHNKSGGLGLFSKWTGGGHSNPNVHDPSIENELAAIFRGVAYGVSTEPTTSTTTTTTTTLRPTTIGIFRRVTTHGAFNPFAIPPPSSIPVSPDGKGVSWKEERPNTKDGERPVQHQYVESPVIEAADNYEGTQPSSVDDSNTLVIRTDVGITDFPWTAFLGVSWQVHVYTTAGLFGLLALLSLYCLTRVHLSIQLLPRGYYITVHLLVFLAAFFRCVYFFHDPYAVEERLPTGLSNILFNTGIPCIITALAVLVLALLRSARVIILPFNLQSPIAVAVVSGALVAGSIVVDAFGGLLKEQELAPGFKGVVQALTAGWGAALCIGYIALFNRVERAAKRQQSELLRHTFSRIHLEGTSLPNRLPKSSLCYGGRFTLIASISGLLLAALQVYGLINSNGVLYIPPPQPWIWFSYQTSCRFLEIVMWTCISIASAFPANLTKNKRNQTGIDDGHLLTVFACKGCTSCSNISTCCSTEKKSSDDLYSSICQTNHVARNYDMSNNSKLVPQDTITSMKLPPRNISTTLLPPKTKNPVTKSATLHSATSDVQLLWNNNSNVNLSNSSSRPSSLILTEGGLIKFRTHDPHSEAIRIINYPKKDFESKPELRDTQRKFLDTTSNTCEDNYINSGALTPEEKRILEKTLKSGKFPHLIENELNSEIYSDVAQNIPCQIGRNNAWEGNITSERRSPGHDICPYESSSVNAANSFDVYLYGDGDPGYCQSNSLDSSIESSGHIYASVKLPPNQGLSFRQRAHRGRTDMPPPVPKRVVAYSPNADIAQTDYLTDASQEFNESPQKVRPHFYEDEDDLNQFYNNRGGISPMRVYNYYIPTMMHRETDGSQTSDYVDDCQVEGDRSCHFTESEGNKFLDMVQDCPSPNACRGLLTKIVTSDFDDISYTSLPGEDLSVPLMKEHHNPSKYVERIRPCGHRPRKLKNSLQLANSPSTFITNTQNSNRQTSNQVIKIEESRREKENIQREIEKTNSKSKKTSPDEPDSRIDFPPTKAHKFPCEGVSWTDSKKAKETPSITSSETPSMERSNYNIHSGGNNNDTGDDDTVEKSLEVRWSPKCREETGV